MKCRACDIEMETVHEAPVAGGTLLACPRCGHSRMPERQRVDLKLPGLDPGRQQRAVVIREEDLQRTIIEALRLKGYEVLVTSRVRKRVQCKSCGEWGWMQGGDGVTKGLADLLCSRQEWGLPVWVGIEVKGSRTAITQAQQDLANRGFNVIVRSLEEAVEALEKIDKRLRSG